MKKKIYSSVIKLVMLSSIMYQSKMINAQSITSYGTSAGSKGAGSCFYGFKAGELNKDSGVGTVSIGSQAGFRNEGTYNIFLGSDAGIQNTDGEYNLFVGAKSGYSNVSGYYNLFIGNQAGYSNIDGYSNVYIGTNAGYSGVNVKGSTLIGSGSGYRNTGNCNTFLGFASGNTNTTGEYNTFIGRQSGYSNVDAYANVFIGDQAGYSSNGSWNTFIGKESGYLNTTGLQNVFVGAQAGFSNTEGGYNVMLGFLTGSSNTTGNSNVFLGYKTGSSNSTGSHNLFAGDSTAMSNTTGNYNIFLGYKAAYSNTTGIGNVYIGHSAGVQSVDGSYNTYLGYGVANTSITGIANVFIGALAGNGCISGRNNTGIGNFASFNSDASYSVSIGSSSKTDFSYSVALGSRSRSTVRNGVVLGRVDVDSALVGIGLSNPSFQFQLSKNDAGKPGSVFWTVTSDRRLKEVIAPYKDGLSTILKINPVLFKYNGKAGLPTTEIFVGIVAQEMQQIAPHTVRSYVYQDTTGVQEEYLSYNPNDVFYMLINSIKELNSLVDQQKQELARQAKEIGELKSSTSLNGSIAMRQQGETSSLKLARLDQNIPNPFSGETVIGYHIPESSQRAVLVIYDMTGKKIKSQEIATRGEGQIKLQLGADLAQGMYIYALMVDGSEVDVKRMIIE